ncbi:hypothetical protein C5167_041878, partial [Papaver somniferum]
WEFLEEKTRTRGGIRRFEEVEQRSVWILLCENPQGLKTGACNSAAGSANTEFGNTKVSVSVMSESHKASNRVGTSGSPSIAMLK